MSLGWVIGLGAPAPVLEETGLLSVVLSLGSVVVSPTWGRVPAVSRDALRDGRWICRRSDPCKSAALYHCTVPRDTVMPLCDPQL